MSIASSVYNESSSNGPPVRPPRRKRSTTSSIISDTDITNLDVSIHKIIQIIPSSIVLKIAIILEFKSKKFQFG